MAFLKLPAELRNTIYADVFLPLETEVTLPLIRSESKLQTSQQPHPALALLLVNKQINCEAREMAWSQIPANFNEIARDSPDFAGLIKEFGEVDDNGDCTTLSYAKALVPRTLREASAILETMDKVLPHITHLEFTSQDAFDMLQGAGFFYGDVEKAVVKIRPALTGVEVITLSKDFDFFFNLADEVFPEEYDDDRGPIDTAPFAYEGKWKKFQAMFPTLKELIMVEDEMHVPGVVQKVNKFLVVDGVLTHAACATPVYR